jgi:hypothetical protein
VKFDLMRRDDIIAKVELNMVRKVANVDLVNGQNGHLYLSEVDSFPGVMDFLLGRSIVERSNYGFLGSIGLNRGCSLFDILEKTNGVKDGDDIWINFSHHKISYQQVVEWIESLKNT